MPLPPALAAPPFPTALCAACMICLLAAPQIGCAQSGRNDGVGGQAIVDPARTTQGRTQGVAVVELFTSQGCSSCPPADHLLTDLAQVAKTRRLPIYTLSMHVDYWDALGWADPYATEQFTKRQRRYAAANGSIRVYTPQMIVGGTAGFVGSNRGDAGDAVRAALAREPAAEVKLDVAAEEDAWRVAYNVTGARAGDELVVCLVADAPRNHVPRGENAGRDLAHSGVVRTLVRQPLATPAATSWPEQSSAGEVALAWPHGQARPASPPSVIAFVQQTRSMKITAAARWAAGN